MDELFSVDDLASICAITPRAVRLYMEKGLLNPLRAGRTYVFTLDCVDRLNTILRCKRLGLSLDDIKFRLDAATVEDLDLLVERIKAISDDATVELERLCQDLSDIRHTRR